MSNSEKHFFPSLSLCFIQLDGKKLYLLQEDNGLIFNPDPRPWKVASSGSILRVGKGSSGGIMSKQRESRLDTVINEVKLWQGTRVGRFKKEIKR